MKQQSLIKRIIKFFLLLSIICFYSCETNLDKQFNKKNWDNLSLKKMGECPSESKLNIDLYIKKYRSAGLSIIKENYDINNIQFIEERAMSLNLLEAKMVIITKENPPAGPSMRVG